MARVVLVKDIQTDYISAVNRFALKMAIDILIGKWCKLAVRTLGALELALVAQLRLPFIDAYWLIAAFPAGVILPSTGKHILSAPEQTTEQRHFLL